MGSFKMLRWGWAVRGSASSADSRGSCRGRGVAGARAAAGEDGRGGWVQSRLRHARRDLAAWMDVSRAKCTARQLYWVDERCLVPEDCLIRLAGVTRGGGACWCWCCSAIAAAGGAGALRGTLCRGTQQQVQRAVEGVYMGSCSGQSCAGSRLSTPSECWDSCTLWPRYCSSGSR